MSTKLVDHIRKDDGTLPRWAWPGGYQISYLFADMETCCGACANGENGSEVEKLRQIEQFPQWDLVGCFIHWEGPSDYCAHCGTEIESEYGDPEEDLCPVCGEDTWVTGTTTDGRDIRSCGDAS